MGIYEGEKQQKKQKTDAYSNLFSKFAARKWRRGIVYAKQANNKNKI